MQCQLMSVDLRGGVISPFVDVHSGSTVSPDDLIWYTHIAE
jgi:hypothetical protein